jgi:nicotinamide-nucleotide amidase
LFLNVGAVSEDVARAMSEGVLAQTNLDAAVAVTGIAGPGGGTPEKPVGLVYIAAARRGFTTLRERHVFPGDRTAVRAASVDSALRMLADLVAR